MTLVYSGLGHLIQSQFGINEITSALAVGKVVGSLFTRKTDAAIFEPLCLQYGIRVKALPLWLRGVSFDRSGTILGENQRKIPAKNTMKDTSIDTIEGLATFLVLILRYVESPENIIDYLESLLKGKFNAIFGGDLSSTFGRKPQSTLPFSLRNVLRSFISSVLDADADSPQHTQSLRFMNFLSKVVGSSRFLNSSTRYSQYYHYMLLGELLGIEKNGHCIWHTFSAGSAMIALAALANGAEVQVECFTDDGGRVIVPPETFRNTNRASFKVVLWLTEPPFEIAHGPGMGVGVGGEPPDSHRKNISKKLPVYGGVAEISCILARQLGCSNTPEEVLALWTRGTEVGQTASWACKPVEPNQSLHFYLTDTFLETQIAAQIAPLADSFYSASRTDRRHSLARKAACIFHEIYRYGDYSNLDNVYFKSSMELIFVSMAVGCLRSLTRGPLNRISSFSWTLDCENDDGDDGIRSLCQRLVTTGVPLSEFLWTAACIWGGSSSSTHNQIRVHERVMGIICPQLTILFNVLHNPKEIADFGVAKGLMSLYEGSVPMLPRDPDTGYILAGNANIGSPPQRINRSRARMPGEPKADLLLSLEPYLQGGSLCALICGWHGGEVALQLDPLNVLHNLLLPNTVLDQDILNFDTSRLIKISGLDLLSIGSFSVEQSDVGILYTQGKAEWKVAAAGSIQPGFAIMVKKELGIDELYHGPSAVSGYTYVLHEDDPQLFPSLSDTQQLHPARPPVRRLSP